jgi:ParG
MRKKVTIGSKPVHGPKAVDADHWVKATEAPDAKTKRLTIDIPLSLHTRVKSQCALQGLQIAEVVREMLDRRFPAEEQRAGRGPAQAASSTPPRRSVES